jgi:hypothetical protein
VFTKARKDQYLFTLRGYNNVLLLHMEAQAVFARLNKFICHSLTVDTILSNYAHKKRNGKIIRILSNAESLDV